MGRYILIRHHLLLNPSERLTITQHYWIILIKTSDQVDNDWDLSSSETGPRAPLTWNTLGSGPVDDG